MRERMVVPSLAGELVTTMPASVMAFILPVAVPLPPDTIAPAWPDRAVNPTHPQYENYTPTSNSLCKCELISGTKYKESGETYPCDGRGAQRYQQQSQQ
jgi:hypothetical protein